MKESREAVWRAMYRLIPSLKEKDETYNERVFTFPKAIDYVAREMFVNAVEHNDDIALVRKALVEMNKKGWVSHEEEE